MRKPPHSQRENFMSGLRVAGTLFLLASFVDLAGSSAAFAQITVRNPNNLPFPDNKPQILLRTACQVVAEEFHIPDPSRLQFPLILVLGEPWHYTADEDNQIYTIYLERWDDTLFATSAMAIASHRVVTKDRYKKMVLEILRRANRISPVEPTDLRKRHARS